MVAGAVDVGPDDGGRWAGAGALGAGEAGDGDRPGERQRRRARVGRMRLNMRL